MVFLFFVLTSAPMRELTFCIRKAIALAILLVTLHTGSFAQGVRPTDSTSHVRKHIDTFPFVIDSQEVVLRVKNLNPFFTLHVDSSLNYRLEINKDQSKYYWYLRNSP